MGRDLLAQDYILKQLSTSLTHPESKIGQVFWETVYEKAYEIFGLYIQMRDSLNVKEVEKAALRKQMEHDHDKELLALQKEQEKKEAVTRLTIISVSSGLVALAVFLFLLYKRFRTIREQSRIINAHNQRMEKELDFGRTVQMSMMPLTFPAFPKRKEIDIYAALRKNWVEISFSSRKTNSVLPSVMSRIRACRLHY